MLIVCIVLFMVGMIIVSFHAQLKDSAFSDKKILMIYLLIGALLFGVGGLFGMENLLSDNPLIYYVIMQLYFLGLGILHLYTMERTFQWSDNHTVYHQFFFTLEVAIIGSIGFLGASWYLGNHAFVYFFWTSIITFFIGFFFRLLWQGTIEFPDPIFQKWFYPISRTVLLPETDELRNPRIISLSMEKTPQAERSTTFVAKAPITMSFGKFFFHFINDYNQRNPEAPIIFKDKNNQPLGWYFSVKPNFLGVSRNINPELTIQANNLKEHSTILCKRIKS